MCSRPRCIPSRSSSQRAAGVLLAAALASAVPAVTGAADAVRRFDFGTGAVAPGFTAVGPDANYEPGTTYGLEDAVAVSAVGRAADDPLRADALIGEKPFYFSADVPEGNYRVTVTLGDPAGGATTTTVKAELRRLMLENVATQPGEIIRRSFIVNVRTPQITAARGVAAGAVELKDREATTEAWAWDGRLTLEFNGTRPGVCGVEIERVTDVPTIFLLGDSTVCDQPRENFASWGQMLTRFFKPDVAVANHAESGETYSASLGRRRLDKIISQMNPGDVLIMQFGHNDQKQRGEGKGPFLSYKQEIKQHIDAVRAVGGIPVIVSPMERRNFNADGTVRPTLADFAEGARQAAAENDAAFIDLHAMSIKFYEALGPQQAPLAFAGNEQRRDPTHHNNYGAYELARCIIEGLRAARLDIARHVIDGLPVFDPAHPDPLDTFAVPPSPRVTNVTPLGS